MDTLTPLERYTTINSVARIAIGGPAERSAQPISTWIAISTNAHTSHAARRRLWLFGLYDSIFIGASPGGRSGRSRGTRPPRFAARPVRRLLRARLPGHPAAVPPPPVQALNTSPAIAAPVNTTPAIAARRASTRHRRRPG